jgi:hypothetical protein
MASEGRPLHGTNVPSARSLVHPDRVADSEKRPDIAHERHQVPLRLAQPTLNAAQPRALDQTLLVEHPLATSGQPALGRSQHRLAQVRQATGRVPPRSA